MDLDHNAHPLNPLPGVVWLLALPIAVVEIVLSLASYGLIGGPSGIGWRVLAIEQYGFSAPIFRWMLTNQVYPGHEMLRLVSYIFVHYSPMHALFVVAFILALGKYVSDVFRPWAVLVLFYVSGVMGAVAYGLFAETNVALIGAYPAVYGLIGGFSFLMWTRLGASGGNRMGAFGLVGFLLGFQLLFGLIFGGNQEWIADLGGFTTGFLLSFVVSPGGVRRAIALIRQR